MLGAFPKAIAYEVIDEAADMKAHGITFSELNDLEKVVDLNSVVNKHLRSWCNGQGRKVQILTGKGSFSDSIP